MTTAPATSQDGRDRIVLNADDQKAFSRVGMPAPEADLPLYCKGGMPHISKYKVLRISRSGDGNQLQSMIG